MGSDGISTREQEKEPSLGMDETALVAADSNVSRRNRVLLMLAGWTLSGNWTKVLGTTNTHHYILLDDSFSMATQTAGKSEFTRAIQSVEKLAEKISAQPGQKVTLIRFSEARRISVGAQADLASRIIDKNFRRDIEQLLKTFKPTQLSVDTTHALTGIEKLIANRPQENKVLHIISDFRKNNWQQATTLKEQLKQLQTQRVQLHLVNSSISNQPNLAITRVQTSASTLAAGVPLRVAVTVKNYSGMSVKNALVSVQYAENPKGTSIGSQNISYPERWQKLPALKFDEIAAGKSVKREIELRFTTAGQHEVQAKLAGDYLSTVDSLATDNVANSHCEYRRRSTSVGDRW